MMSPAGGRHGRIAGKLLTRIAVHVEKQRLGHTFAAETGFLLRTNPDTVRAPDVAFVSTERLGDLVDHTGYLPVAPELVAEVVSPGDAPSKVDDKVAAWLHFGVLIVLVVDPELKSVRLYSAGKAPQKHRGGAVDLHAAIAGFELDVDELFA